MNDDYLWTGRGEPDPDVARLERALGRYAHAAAPPDLERLARAAAAAEAARPRGAAGWLARAFGGASRRPALAWAAACALLVTVAAVTREAARPSAPAWTVARLEGAPRAGGARLAGAGRLAVGEWLETDAASRARLEVGTIGTVTLEPGSRLRLVRAAEDDHRLALERGAIEAFIVAPPRRFAVETPSALAVDLGCAYRLEVDRGGGALVRVLSGWVSFEGRGREAFVPAGASCRTWPGRGPGIPWVEEADAAFVAALAALDEAADAAARRGALRAALERSRPADALSLWHLLARFEGEERAAVYARLAALAPPPAGVTREAVLRGERAALDAWWNALGYGDVEWWRLWQGDPPA